MEMSFLYLEVEQLWTFKKLFITWLTGQAVFIAKSNGGVISFRLRASEVLSMSPQGYEIPRYLPQVHEPDQSI